MKSMVSSIIMEVPLPVWKLAFCLVASLSIIMLPVCVLLEVCITPDIQWFMIILGPMQSFIIIELHCLFISVYDHPWSNAKAGLIRGLFLLGTAFISYGAGSMIGYALPGMMGLVVSSVAGALIGATAGAIYGAWEDSVYHDYSGLWKNILSFSVWV